MEPREQSQSHVWRRLPLWFKSCRDSLRDADGRQRLRMTRHLMAAGSSILVIGLLYAYYVNGNLPRGVLLVSAGSIAFLIVFFNVLFRTRLNTHFRDPSLTMPQIASALAVLVYVNFHLVQGRGAFLLVYIMAVLFGVFRLTSSQLMALIVPVIGAHAFLVVDRVAKGSEASIEALQWLVLSIVLVWFCQLGGYISAMRRQVRALVTRDELTGVYSRRHMLDLLRSEKARADRSRDALTVAMLDLDRFKAINDEYGHGGGDVVLADFASLVVQTIRQSDHFGRYGGEEFMLVLPGTAAGAAETLLQRIREQTHEVGGRRLPRAHTVTVSAGLSEYRRGESIEQLIEKADQALYAAKSGGRDRIVSAAQTQSGMSAAVAPGQTV